MNIKLKKFLIILMAFLLGALSYFLVLNFFNKSLTQVNNDGENFSIRDKDSDDFKFINPLLDCSEPSDISNKKIVDIKNKVEGFIFENKQLGKVTEVAVYYRDLNNGPWFGINEKMSFSPASLLKVPLMMAVYREAMLEPDFLNKKIEVTDNGFNSVETIKSENSIKKGEKRTVGEAVEFMIKYSDNNASHLLNSIVDERIYEETYKDLGVEIPDKIDYTISVRTYASFFRILFNSTFLWQPYSELSLRLLSESEFKEGLIAGVPGNVVVAHKFGERILEDGKMQLHDCGIIYDKKNPYLICVMTRGNKTDYLKTVISGVSKIIYENLQK